MRAKDILTIGLIEFLSVTLSHPEDSPGVTNATVNQSETIPIAELTQLLAMTQDAPPSPPGPAANLRFRQHPGGRIEITPEFLDQCMEVAEQVNPEWAKMMRSVCERSPEDFERYLRQTGRQLIGLVQLKQRDPNLYATKLKELHLEAHLKTLTQKLRFLHAEGRDDSSEAVEVRSELRVLVQEQVALALKSRGDYVIRLEKHVATLKKQLEDDALSFFRTVEDHYQVLTTMPNTK